jgi:hypothetical protein
VAATLGALVLLLGGSVLAAGIAISVGQRSGIPSWARVFIALFIWLFFVSAPILTLVIFLTGRWS